MPPKMLTIPTEFRDALLGLLMTKMPMAEAEPYVVMLRQLPPVAAASSIDGSADADLRGPPKV